MVKLDGHWGDNNEEWTPDELAYHFWPIAMRYVQGRWSHLPRVPMLQPEDIQGLATEALVKTSQRWHEWCMDKKADPTAKRLFWWHARTDIDYAIKDYLALKGTSQHLSIELDEERLSDGTGGLEWARTQIQASNPHSTLNASIVDYIDTMPILYRVVIALYYYEEIAHRDIAVLFGLATPSISPKVRQAATRVLYEANRQVGETSLEPWAETARTPFTIRPSLTDWLRTNYGTTDVETYLKYVSIHMHTDVSYAVEIINHAHGNLRAKASRMQPRKPNAMNGLKLTDDEVRSILERLANREPARHIAKSLGIGENTVFRIKSGKRKPLGDAA